MGHLIEPHGGKLVELYCPPDLADSLKKQSINYYSIDLTPRQLFDLELILNGGFSPLQGFMTQAEYDSVVEKGVLVMTSIVISDYLKCCTRNVCNRCSCNY